MTTPSIPQAITSEIQKLAPSAVIELFVLNLALFGAGVTRIHAGTNALRQRVVWQGEAYDPFPVQVEGFELNGNGQVPRPKMKVANLTGSITALVLLYQDLVGAKITRKRTLAKYLDAANFAGGVNPSADATAEFADDIYYVDRKSRETRDVVEFELAASFDLEGVALPRRQIVQNVCPWKYRGSECGYTGTAYFDAHDRAVSASSLDVCGKRLSSCQARFGQNAELSFGGFPAAGLFR
ncbi:MAG: phage minor tail protein L [Candidatus Protistobacter heckmanni]|nr:phage minor tail protein L [Candidatus Protistobacter heckmanni]